jgi:hypothetical protein
MADLARRSQRPFSIRQQGLIGMAKQPDSMREITQRRRQAAMTPVASERAMRRRIVSSSNA